MTVKETAAFLRQHDNYLILTHKRPDGDTIGCAAALCEGLRALGRTAWICPHTEETHLFTPYLEGRLAPEGYVPETVVSVDIAARSLDAGRAACGELIYDILRELGPITPAMAVPLYVAVSTDTGCFQYSNTTADTHRTAAALMETGIPAAELNKRHFRTKTLKRLRIESRIVEGMELFDGGETAVAAVDLAMVAQLGADERDLEDIASFVGQVEGVKNAITIRELRPGTCKLSLRTDPEVLNASRVCALLGGGGHAAASGATVEGSVEEAKRAILWAIEQVRHG